MKIHILAQIEDRLGELAGDQLPFITSVALNKTAIGSRDKVKANLPKRFTLRNSWTQRGIQAGMSNKHSLQAAVFAPDYMQIQETGGEKRPTRSKLLAAPAKPTRRVIPKSKRPRAVLADRAFIIDMGGGDAGVFIRYGRRRGQIRLLWWLSPEQEYDDRFEFEQDVNDYVQDRFSTHFLEQWTKVVWKGGYAESGKAGRKRNDRPEGMSARAWRRAQSKP